MTSNTLIDISVAVHPNLPRWPGSPAIEFTPEHDLAHGDIATDTTIRFSVHTGTHVDAPRHFLQAGNTVETLPLDILIGPVTIIDLSHVDAIEPQHLAQAVIPPRTQRLLVRTRNSQHWQQKSAEFDPNFVAFTAQSAQWLVDQGIKLVGIDYLSVQRFQDDATTHQILLGAEVVIIEGLNLGHVPPGDYELICLPLKLQGLEGAPARVILKT